MMSPTASLVLAAAKTMVSAARAGSAAHRHVASSSAAARIFRLASMTVPSIHAKYDISRELCRRGREATRSRPGDHDVRGFDDRRHLVGHLEGEVVEGID